MVGLQTSTNFLVTKVDAIIITFDLWDDPGVDDLMVLREKD
jgi:hypothetical protein